MILSNPKAENIQSLFLRRFNDCTPSLAIVICENFILQEHQDIARIQQLQNDFRNGFAIISGIEDPNIWLDVQCSIDFGNVRLFQAQSTEDIVSLINTIHHAMKNKTKFELQTQILEQERSNLTDPAKIREMVRNLMSEMDIPPFEAEQILLHHKTFKNIVLNCGNFENPDTKEKFYSVESAEKLSALFSTFKDDNDSNMEQEI